MDSLAQVLRHERDVLETLLFRLDEAALVAAAQGDRWWERASRDVDAAVSTARSTELLRAVAALDTALQLGLEPGATLRMLAAAIGQPDRSVLLEHREAIRALTTEIGDAVDRLGVRRAEIVCELPSLEAFLR